MALPPVTFPTLGFQVVAWYEHMLCHGPGDIAGEPWVIDDEFALFICWLYRLHPKGHKEAGRRLAQRAILSRPKGRAKSELAGGVVCGEALGPVRFDRWAKGGETTDWGYEYMRGEPIGRPVRYPFIRCLATEEGQAGNTYDNVYLMLTQGEASDYYGLREGREVGLTRTFLPAGGEIRPSTAGNASKDGGLETCSVGDETHLYVQPALRGMYRTVARNTGKRKDGEPLMLDTTTAWKPGENSIAEQAADKYADRPVEETLQKAGVLYDHRQGDKPKRFGDDRSLIKAMRVGYGPASEWTDFKRIVRIIRDAEDPEEEAYRYYLNRPRLGSSHWLDPAEIEAVLDEFDVALGSMIGVGFDGSEVDDHTTLWGCLEDGRLFPIGMWAPSSEDEGWRLEVDATVRWTFANFQVVRFYSDPPWWQQELGEWARDFSDPDRAGTLPVAEWWTNRDTPMAVACGALRTEIRQQRTRIRTNPLRTPPLHVVRNEVIRDAVEDGKPLAVFHFENGRKRKVKIKLEDKAEEAHVVTKDRPGSPLKIDSIPAAALAKKARDDGVKEGEFVERTYGRASFSGGEGRAKKAVDRSDYIPCRNCEKPIHPNLHAPDSAEQGLCLKCRTGRG